MKKRKIMLVTMATPISSHVKDKNSIFIARDEDMIFQLKEKSWYFISIYIIKIIISKLEKRDPTSLLVFVVF